MASAGVRRLVSADSKVAVIGLGAAGIAAVLGLRANGFRNITVFEATGHAGGAWVYSPSVENSQSSMYESLRCNIPKQCMCYTDFPFPESVPSFAPHADVAAYLQAIVEKEDIYPLVRFHSPVARCAPVDPSSFNTPWEIQTYLDVERSAGLPWERQEFANSIPNAREDGQTLSKAEVFDAVFVCNGHYTVPNRWRPAGEELFPGVVMHSHYYRRPDRFVGKNVVVLGSGPSGTDLAMELQRAGADVTLSHRNGKGKSKFGGLCNQAAPLVALRSDGSVVLDDGSVLPNIHEVLLCTGYEYSMPFLSRDAGVHPSDDMRAVQGLYMHCVVQKHPTLCLIGLPFKIIPFPLFMDQVCFVCALLLDKLPFSVTPDSITRLCAEERQSRDPRQPMKYLHCLGDMQWEYRRKLTDWTGRPSPSPALVELYNDSRAARGNDPKTYRNREYVIVGHGPGQWRVVENGQDVTLKQDPGTQNSS